MLWLIVRHCFLSSQARSLCALREPAAINVLANSKYEKGNEEEDAAEK
jgi:hypothetical protein